MTATTLGDHRFDDRLEDRSSDGVQAELGALRGRLAALDTLDVRELDVADRVDRDILAGGLAARVFDLTELREHEWNPMHANPGDALHLLLARDYAPLPDRLRALGGRLAAIPAALAQSRATLRDMPEVHLGRGPPRRRHSPAGMLARAQHAIDGQEHRQRLVELELTEQYPLPSVIALAATRGRTPIHARRLIRAESTGQRAASPPAGHQRGRRKVLSTVRRASTTFSARRATTSCCRVIAASAPSSLGSSATYPADIRDVPAGHCADVGVEPTPTSQPAEDR